MGFLERDHEIVKGKKVFSLDNQSIFNCYRYLCGIATLSICDKAVRFYLVNKNSERIAIIPEQQHLWLNMFHSPGGLNHLSG